MTFWHARPGRALARAAVLALLCPAVLPAQQRKGLLVGRVLSGDVAVPGAVISVSGGRGVTIARVDGRYRISLPAGRYEVRAQRIGYTTARDSVTVGDATPDTLNFRLERATTPLEAVATVASPGEERSAIDASAPVDVIDGTQLRATGRTATSRALQATAPSVTVSHETTGQGSDLIHPFALRGLGPDHVLVLVNGKRRHQSALVNVNRSIGRGSSGVDLDAIPASLIDRIEILHGDAVAEYGSDAIAGVVNIVLKSGVHGFATATSGGAATSFNRDEPATASPYRGGGRWARDGDAFQAAIDKGIVFGERGFLHGGVELRGRETTNRAVRSPIEVGYADEHWGDPRTRDVALMLNGGNLFPNGLELYASGGGSVRGIQAPALSTLGSQPFVPTIDADVDDYAATVGVRGQSDDWRWDLGTVYGWNRVGLEVAPGVNPFIGTVRATRLDAGAQRFAQSTTTLELAREVGVAEREVRLALGAELRHDAYRVWAGEPAAYAPDPFVAPYWYGLSAFAPAQASNQSRDVLGAHASLESDVTGALRLGLSGRVDRYSDVGRLYAGKATARYEPTRKVVLRGSVARGFRAPSLQQSSLRMIYLDPFVTSTTSSPAEIVPPTDPRATGGWGVPLRAERSTDFQAGIAIEATPALSFTLDAYRSDVRDRVLLSDAYASTSGTTYAHFFGNFADTRTDGLDATASYGVRLGAVSTLRLTAGANVNHTGVTRVLSRVDPLVGVYEPVYVVEQERLTRATPRDNLLASAALTHRSIGALLRVQRFGKVSGTGSSELPIVEHTYAPRWLTDVNASWTLARKYTFTAGADNLFDVYPERSAVGTNPFYPGAVPLRQISPYDAVSPFGFNGRFVYGRLSIYL